MTKEEFIKIIRKLSIANGDINAMYFLSPNEPDLAQVYDDAMENIKEVIDFLIEKYNEIVMPDDSPR